MRVRQTSPRITRRGLVLAILQVAVAAAILGWLLHLWGAGPFLDALHRLPWYAVPLGMALGAVGILTQAQRWRLVARHHGIDVGFGSAVARVWQAAFLNSVLPGGLAGDALRVVDDSTDAEAPGRRRALAKSLAAVSAERLAGTAVVFAGAALALSSHWLPGSLLCGGVALAVAVVAWPWLRGLGARGLGRVLLLSVAGWAAFMALFAVSCAAIAPQVAGTDVPGLGAIVLGGMSVPFNAAGWGPREGAAAYGFALLGYPGGLGVSVSVGYGVLALASTLPGALVLAVRLARRYRSRR